MIRMTADKIADVAMVGVAKVKKDISKGKLDADSLADIVRYVQGYRMLAGGLKVWDGVMQRLADEEELAKNPPVHQGDAPRSMDFGLDVGAGMTTIGFTPSYSDGQCDDTWEAEY